MPTAIIIGFEYVDKPLTGALIDIFNAYKWCNSFCDNIFVITDITKVTDITNLISAVNDGFATKKLFTFYDKITKILVNTSVELSLTIIKILENLLFDDKLVIYYTGHGHKSAMVMPDKSSLPFVELRDIVTNLTPPKLEIFWILDCCNPNGMCLPFVFNKGEFRLTSTELSSLYFVSQPILLITSSNNEEKSLATNHGSLFSRYLFNILNNMGNSNRNLRKLINNLSSSIKKMCTGYSQTVSIYSSYVFDPILWMWITPGKSDIVSDITLTSLVIRNYTKDRTIR